MENFGLGPSTQNVSLHHCLKNKLNLMISSVKFCSKYVDVLLRWISGASTLRLMVMVWWRWCVKYFVVCTVIYIPWQHTLWVCNIRHECTTYFTRVIHTLQKRNVLFSLQHTIKLCNILIGYGTTGVWIFCLFLYIYVFKVSASALS